MLTGRLWVPLREAGSADPQAAEAAFSKQVCVIVSEKNKRNLSVQGAGVCAAAQVFTLEMLVPNLRGCFWGKVAGIADVCSPEGRVPVSGFTQQKILCHVCVRMAKNASVLHL